MLITAYDIFDFYLIFLKILNESGCFYFFCMPLSKLAIFIISESIYFSMIIKCKYPDSLNIIVWLDPQATFVIFY